jgi:hypothetical protein
MKKYQAALMCLCFCVCGTAMAEPAPAAVTDPLAVSAANVDDYYITKGDTYDKVTGLLASLSSDVSGLDKQAEPYYFRMDKTLTGDYFYHVRAYATATHVLISDFFVAKDDSCAWRLFQGKDAVQVYGNADKLMKKVEVLTYPDEIPMGSYGLLRIHIPGMLPYDMKVTSLNETIATIDGKHIKPVSDGTTNVLVDLKIGNSMKTFQLPVKVVQKKYKSQGGSSGPRPSIGIGIGWGSGGWHHHGGVGIGIGWGGWDDGYWDD